MADPYRTACEQSSWSVTYRYPLPMPGPYRFCSCTTFGVLARDETEAIAKVLKGRHYEVTDVHEIRKRSEP